MKGKARAQADETAGVGHRTLRATDGRTGASPSGPADFAINARVRQVLTRRWVRTDGLDVGTTDGVVLIRGRLEREPGGLTLSSDPDAGERFARRLKSEIKAIPGVTDVLMEIHETERGAR